MDIKYDEQLLIIQATIEYKKKKTELNTDDKLTKIKEYLKVLTSTITSMMNQTNNSKFSPAH